MGTEQREKLLPLVKDKAFKFGLDYKLVDAIIQTESNYNIYAVRFEPKYSSFVIPSKFARINMVTADTEEVLQKVSWGICQIMGSTARWMGYMGPMPLLCDVETNLNWGCRFMRKLKDDYAITENMIAAYNAGSVKRTSDGVFMNQAYVDKVMKAYNAP